MNNNENDTVYIWFQDALKKDNLLSRNPCGIVTSVIAHFVFLACMIAIVCESGVIVCAILLVVSYIVILIEAKCSPAHSYVTGFMDADTALAMVEQVSSGIL